MTNYPQKRNRLRWLVILLVLLSCPAFAQTIPVSGTVVSEIDGLPLPGVNVIVKGTAKGVVTDFNGTYSIEAPADGTLVFSYIGFEEEEVPING